MHALLSPSSAHRWMACTPSARLEELMPDKAGEAAAEGSFAHSICEAQLRVRNGMMKHSDFNDIMTAAQANPFYSEDMLTYVSTYVTLIEEKLNEARARNSDAQLFVEVVLDLKDYIPQGFGTADAIIIADNTLEVVDFKYGKGVPVTAYQNAQMKIYALGAIKKFGYLFAFDNVRMTIVQPRLDSISSFELSVSELIGWGSGDLRVSAQLAFEGAGTYSVGEHCRFCRAFAQCKARRDEALDLLRYEAIKEDLLDKADIADILSRSASVKQWLTAVEEFALDQAVNHDVSYPGYKLVEGRSIRQYSDADKVADTLTAAGYDESILYKRTLLGITDMQKVLGKKAFDSLLDGLLYKPQGKPTLVTIDDKRAEWKASAESDFQDVIN